ncbi:hypothetical protein PN36_24430 [Candidatus Thiomargarita nelsonii]|uniref:Secreted protein n=1 Tax=Candidatus Thiomargarita nelsonii TaxID=1003181 RepID=A0A0A6P750_9GAMM|nr:hypothetical protein PN36_24430 [Candidatus Thiomargarita nelsonii]
MNKTFFKIFSVLLISLLAGYAQADDSFWLPYAQANIISTVNPILAVKSLAKQNPDKVPAIAASFAKRFPDAAADIAATLAKEFPDQATEIARAVAAALAGEIYEPPVQKLVPKTADEIFAQMTQDIAGKDSDIDRTTTMVASFEPSDPGEISQPDYFFFPYHHTSGGRPIITGGSTCMEVCLAGRNCSSLVKCPDTVTPNTPNPACNEVVQCEPALCSEWCKNS